MVKSTNTWRTSPLSSFTIKFHKDILEAEVSKNTVFLPESKKIIETWSSTFCSRESHSICNMQTECLSQDIMQTVIASLLNKMLFMHDKRRSGLWEMALCVSSIQVSSNQFKISRIDNLL